MKERRASSWDDEAFRDVVEGLDRRNGSFPPGIWNDYGEEFRRLRTKVMAYFEGEPHKCILITSSLPKEGKTTIAMNLARAMAQADRKTLLIDADMRAPMVHRHFGLSLSPGLGDILRGGHDAAAAICTTDVKGLRVLTAGDAAQAPAELINSPAMKNLILESCAAYDYILVDSPPIISITDATLLGQFAHGIIVVIRNGLTPREAVTSALEEIKGQPVIGTVLNGVEGGETYYGYGHHYY